MANGKDDDGFLKGLGRRFDKYLSGKAKAQYEKEQQAQRDVEAKAAARRKAELEDIRKRTSTGGSSGGSGLGAPTKSTNVPRGVGGYGGRGDVLRQQEMERQTGFRRSAYKPGQAGKGANGMGGKNAASAAARERRLRKVII